MLNKYPYHLFFQWLLLASVVIFLFYLAVDYGVLSNIVGSDVTRISVIIILVFIGVSCFCAWRCFVVSHQLNLCPQLFSKAQGDFPDQAFDSWVQDYWQACQLGKNQSVMAEILAEKLSGANQIGWFFSALIIKLGLLGTVIGFVIMLSSISSIDALVVDDIKNLMQQMTQGMGVAMNTTMVGLVCSMLTGLQYLLLDRYCDRVLVDVIERVNQELV